MWLMYVKHKYIWICNFNFLFYSPKFLKNNIGIENKRKQESKGVSHSYHIVYRYFLETRDGEVASLSQNMPTAVYETIL